MTIRTARCLTSSEYRIELFMTPSSQRVESPVNPGRFSLACRAKGPAPATRNFSGNGIAVALMCAVLHQYRPVAANEGGVSSRKPHEK